MTKTKSEKIQALIKDLKIEADSLFAEWVKKHREYITAIDIAYADGTDPLLSKAKAAKAWSSYERWITMNLTNIGLVGITDQLTGTPMTIQIDLFSKFNKFARCSEIESKS